MSKFIGNSEITKGNKSNKAKHARKKNVIDEGSVTISEASSSHSALPG